MRVTEVRTGISKFIKVDTPSLLRPKKGRDLRIFVKFCTARKSYSN
jgi:hypothetical protein